MQFVLLVIAVISAGYFLRASVGSGLRRVALIAIGNLAVNLTFFLTHPLFSSYYIVPVAMLSIWSIAFAALTAPMEAVDEGLVGQAVKA
jgi:uncharacterized membrane-anchored protein